MTKDKKIQKIQLLLYQVEFEAQTWKEKLELCKMISELDNNFILMDRDDHIVFMYKYPKDISGDVVGVFKK